MTAAYGTLVERNNFALRRFTVPVLPPGSPDIRVLQLSDLHVRAQQRWKVAWVRRLARFNPDLVISTGDHVGGDEHAFENSLRAHEPFVGLPGAFIWGNNDHFASVPKSPIHYFTGGGPHRRGARIDLGALREQLTSGGWLDLNNSVGTLDVAGVRIGFGGTDDPHTHRDRYAEIAGRIAADADVRIGLTHSPEPRVLDWFADDGYDLVLAGHTHGGQVRIPIYGAPTTNCGIDRSRVRWLSSWTSPAGNDTTLHVSAGLGTSPYAPIRFCCRPEATLLTLTARR
ncbi:MAG: metallophosphoesterase [Cumulibacter sp.]